MLHIAVCDDEITSLNEIANILFNYCTEKSIDFIISKYNDGSEIPIDTEQFDIYFLDIEMTHSNGIEIAQKIRKNDLNVPVVYITSYSDYWQRAFKVHAFSYISKPFTAEELYNIMNDYFKIQKQKVKSSVVFHTENGAERFEVDEICYFIFKSKKQVYINTVSKQVLILENLSDIYSKLDKQIFYQTKRNCIVNLNYVQKLQNNYVILLKDGTMLPLAQKKKEDFMAKLSKNLIKTLKGTKQ